MTTVQLNTVTRKVEVFASARDVQARSDIAALQADKVGKTGDTMTGDLALPRALSNLTPSYDFASGVLDYAVSLGDYDAGNDRHQFDITINPTQQFNFIRLDGTVRGDGSEIGKFAALNFNITSTDATSVTSADTATTYFISGRLNANNNQENKAIRIGLTDISDGSRSPILVGGLFDVTVQATSGLSKPMRLVINNANSTPADGVADFIQMVANRSGSEARPLVRRGILMERLGFTQAAFEVRLVDSSTLNDGANSDSAADADFLRLRYVADTGSTTDRFAVDLNGIVTEGEWNAREVAVAYGGTGLTSYTVGDLLYASGATTLAKLAGVATGNALISGGVGVAPSWGKIGLTTHVSGTLAIGNGGTGATTAAGARTNLDVPGLSSANTFTNDNVFTNDLWVQNAVPRNFYLDNTTASPSSGTTIGVLRYQAKDSAGNDTTYAQVRGFVDDSTDASEDGYVSHRAINGGALSEQMRVGNGVQFKGIGTTASAANAFLDSGSSPSNNLLRSTSSLAYKRDVEPIDAARIDASLALSGIWYRSTAPADNPDWSWYGFAAEDVAAVDPRLVHWGYHDDDYDVIDVEVEEKVATGKRDRKGQPIFTTMRTIEREHRLKPGATLKPDGVMYERVAVFTHELVRRHEARIAALEAQLGAV